MRGRSVRLFAAGPPAPDPDLLHWLATALRSRVGIVPLPDRAFALRGVSDAQPEPRASSTRLVDDLIARDEAVGAVPPGEWALAITAADLYGESRDFVFGEATVRGAWAVVSTARLWSDDPDRFRSRLLKESLHELGHLAGLQHCSSPACVMAPSTYAADVDEKSDRFCPRCSGDLGLPRDP